MADDHLREGGDVSLKVYENTHEYRKNEAVPEDVAEDGAFMSVPVGRRARHNDALGVYHLTHHTSGTVGCAHQNGADSQLL